MLWKERYVSRTGAVTKIVAGLTFLGVGAMIAYAGLDFVIKAFGELLANGYGSNGTINSARDEFNVYIRVVGTIIFVVWGLGVAGAASSGLTSEREEDTWLSLISTPLSGLEIVRAKMIGAVWGTRWLGAFLLVLWLTGLAAGALHPFGFMAVVVATVVFLWFMTALGTYASLVSRTTGRAQATTMAILIFLNGGYMMCCIPLRPETALISLGCAPFIEAMVPITYDNFHDLAGWFFGETSSFRRLGGEGVVGACVLGVVGYAVAAAVLTNMTIARFDEVAGRPRRGEGHGLPHDPTKAAKPDLAGDGLVDEDDV